MNQTWKQLSSNFLSTIKILHFSEVFLFGRTVIELDELCTVKLGNSKLIDSKQSVVRGHS